MELTRNTVNVRSSASLERERSRERLDGECVSGGWLVLENEQFLAQLMPMSGRANGYGECSRDSRPFGSGTGAKLERLFRRVSRPAH